MVAAKLSIIVALLMASAVPVVAHAVNKPSAERAVVSKVTSKAVAKKIANYMNGLEHVKAEFTQFSGNAVATGVAIIDYPNTVSIEYLTPKRVDIKYDKNTKGAVSYYDHRLKQEKHIRVQSNAMQLLLEDDWESAVEIQNIETMDTIYIVRIIYKNEHLTLSFNKDPIALKSIRIDGRGGGQGSSKGSGQVGSKGRKSTVSMDFKKIERTKNAPPLVRPLSPTPT